MGVNSYGTLRRGRILAIRNRLVKTDSKLLFADSKLFSSVSEIQPFITVRTKDLFSKRFEKLYQ